MKTFSMMSSALLISVILAVWFLPFGYCVKCHHSLCFNSSSAPGVTTCPTPPMEVNCSAFPEIPGMAYDACYIQRVMNEEPDNRGDVIVTDTEVASCTYSFRCVPSIYEIYCNAANTSGSMKKCEIGCCQEDLCNSGGPIPTQALGPTGPSGADLSCSTCSNIPGQGDQRDCNDSVTQACGDGQQIPLVPQDRCMSVTAVANIPGLPQPMEYRMKNCSNAAMCHQGAFCASANASVNGTLESCQLSCCFGNNCNGAMTTTAAATTITTAAAAGTQPGGTAAPTPGGTAAPTPGGTAATTPGGTAAPSVPSTALTCFAALLSYFYFRPIMA